MPIHYRPSLEDILRVGLLMQETEFSGWAAPAPGEGAAQPETGRPGKTPQEEGNMTENTNSLLLEGLVECGPCGRKMTTVNDPTHRYACPVLLQNGLDDCPTPPVAVEQLDIAAVRWMTGDLLTEQWVGQVTQQIMTTAAARKEPPQRNLENARRELRRQEEERRGLIELVESGRTTFQQAEPRIGELNGRRDELLEQADSAREDVKMWEFIGQESGIQETMRDIHTYLKPGAREFTQELMGLILERIVAGPREIIFIPVPGIPANESRIGR